MTKSEKAKAIIHLVDKSLKVILNDKIKAYADHEGEIAGYNRWEKEQKENNDYSGGFGPVNPYNLERSRKRLSSVSEEYEKWRELREFVIDTFLDMIDKEITG